jgi:hypothetical protein
MEALLSMLLLTNSMQIYFREALDAAIRSSNVVVSEPTQVYVVHLLNEFSRSEVAFAGADHGEQLIMVDMLERAFGSNSREALRIFRHMGDSSLYLLGFFKESSKKRIVSNSYYQDIGAQAYSLASDLSRVYAAQSAAIFQELSENFPDVVRLLENISTYGDATT